MTNNSYFKYLDRVIEIAEEAGQEIMAFYELKHLDAQEKIDEKGDNSPVTEADIAAHKIITSQLAELADIAIVSEEASREENEQAANQHMFWLVDPLDGTKSFIKKDGQFTVNIALVVDKDPVMGVVHIPAEGSTYYNSPDGAFRRTENGDEKISVSESDKVLNAVASKNHLDEKLMLM